MILLSLDFESTGLDTNNDDPIEMGAVLYSTTQHKCLDSQGMLIKTERKISKEITDITGIHSAAIDRFGYEAEDIFDNLNYLMESCDTVIGYNVNRFDKKLALSWAQRLNRTLPAKTWIDLFTDLPWQVPRGKLAHLAADHGLINLFPHSALSDAQTVLSIAGKYDPQSLLDRALSPVVILRSKQDRANNDAVKKAPFQFRWNPDNKIWFKAVKQQDVDEIIQSASFPIVIEKELTQEELDS